MAPTVAVAILKIIIKGVRGGKYDIAIVKDDPGFVMKYDAKIKGKTAIMPIRPLVCWASCSDVNKVPIAA